MTDLLLVDENSQRRLDTWDRLVEEGYRVDMVSERSEALAKALSGCFDLVILALRDGESIRVCQELRRRGFDGAIILVMASEQVHERILGLKLGADDALTSPFELVELVARIEACLRRGPVPTERGTLRFGEVAVDLCGRRVLRAGQVVPLSPREFQLLCCLAQHAGMPVSRAELLDCAWGRDAMPSPQTVDVHVAWLRRKLEADPQRPTLIRTVHGVGYVLGAKAGGE